MIGVCEGEGGANELDPGRALDSATLLITEGISSFTIDGGGFRAIGADFVGDS